MFGQKFNKLSRVFRRIKKRAVITISRRQHNVSRQNISSNALKVLYRLNEVGFSAYLVGGSVRDLLLKMQPKDFDVVTDALPQEVRSLFKNSRLIGRRFQIVHVYFRDEIVEVSTFRANSEESMRQVDPEAPFAIQSDNIFGTIEEDAWRRDFTVNALYYNIADFSVVDYTGGMRDLHDRLIRMIGDPAQRYHEDPVRLLRAIRLAAKLNFKIEHATEKPLFELSHLLDHVPGSRLFDEVIKLFFKGYAEKTFQRLNYYRYIEVIFPSYAEGVSRNTYKNNKLLQLALQATDQRFSSGKSLNPGFLFAVILWPHVKSILEKKEKNRSRPYQILHHAIDDVLTLQTQHVTIPKRYKAMMRSIWVLQFHLLKRRGKRVFRMLGHRYFRAAFDFLELRAKAGEPFGEIVNWWQVFQDASPEKRQKMITELAG